MVVALICIPINSVGGFPFLHTLSSVYYLYILDDSHAKCKTKLPSAPTPFHSEFAGIGRDLMLLPSSCVCRHWSGLSGAS